jgi:hypothetical protein
LVLMQQNGVVNPPNEGHTQTAYRRDLPYRHFVSSWPLAIGALLWIGPSRCRTAAHIVMPGWHRIELTHRLRRSRK